MSWDEDFEQGLAGYLDAQGVGTYDNSGFTGSLALGPLPDEIDSGIGITTYRLGVDDPSHPSTRVNVQLYARALTRAAVNALDARGYDAVHGLKDAWFGAAHVTQAVSKSSMPMGPDERGRFERSSNYTFELDLPATALRSY
jgi:hypothetical protein